MNILFLNHNVAWTGGFFRAYHWGRYLVKAGHKVTIVTISENNSVKFSKATKDGVVIIKSPDLFHGKYRTGWDPYDTIRRIIYLRKMKFDVIHCVDARPNVILPGLFIKYFNGGKLVMDWGDWWGRGGTISERSNSIAEKIFEPIETFFEEYFRRFGDGHVVLTEALKNRYINLKLSRPVITIPHGADTFNIQPKEKTNTRKRYGYSENSYIIGYLGTIFGRDLELLVEAVRIARQLLPELTLLIIGNCKAEFPSDLINDKIIIKTGKLDFDIMTDYIAICDFMLLPLKNFIANKGRWPSKISDYLSAGRPVIYTQVGDISELFNDSKAGIQAEDNPISFANAIVQGAKINNLDEMEVAARTISVEKLSWEKLTFTLEEFYNTLT